jgi:hypothetical protein
MISDTYYSGLYYMIKYGEQTRACVDIGFSTVEDNSKPELLPCT